MDSSSMKRSHAAAINQALFPGVNYLCRLRKRMAEVGFPPGDKLYILVEKAYDAVQELSIETHYLSCNGAGRPRKEE